MALGHTVSGLMVGVLTSPAAGDDPRSRVAWTLTVAGCALLPDHPSASVSRMWGPITAGYRVRIAGKRRTLIPGTTHIVSVLAGGHRKGTHSMLGLATMLLFVYLAAFHPVVSAFVLAFVFGVVILGASILAGTSPGRVWVPNLIASGLLAWYLVFELGWTLPVWLGPAMTLGAFIHILGDACTEQGVPLSWPLLGVKRFRLMTINTDGPVEKLAVLPLTWVVTVWWFAWWELSLVPGPHTVIATLFGGLHRE